MSETISQRFLKFALETRALLFGQFRTKAGRISPYFFNAGLFNDGRSLARLGHFYAETIQAAGLDFDMLFGPAYKGIPLATVTATALAERFGRNVPFAFNRKEAKDHGEGGALIGAPPAGRILLVDDVISAGTSIRESFQLLEAAGARPAGVVIALDRQERGTGATGAVQEVENQWKIPVVAIARLEDLIRMLEQDEARKETCAAIRDYRLRYGIR
ncbi:MAG: orotate phosphoribosyltransferase [Magnetococcales bacterium]|nr:orotate phosphoribosyltransferase [Magnetococcales bacterium]